MYVAVLDDTEGYSGVLTFAGSSMTVTHVPKAWKIMADKDYPRQVPASKEKVLNAECVRERMRARVSVSPCVIASIRPSVRACATHKRARSRGRPVSACASQVGPPTACAARWLAQHPPPAGVYQPKAVVRPNSTTQCPHARSHARTHARTHARRPAARPGRLRWRAQSRRRRGEGASRVPALPTALVSNSSWAPRPGVSVRCVWQAPKPTSPLVYIVPLLLVGLLYYFFFVK